MEIYKTVSLQEVTKAAMLKARGDFMANEELKDFNAMLQDKKDMLSLIHISEPTRP